MRRGARAAWVAAGAGTAALGAVAVAAVRVVRRRRVPVPGKPTSAVDLSGAPYPLMAESPRRAVGARGNVRVLGPETEPAAVQRLAGWVPAPPASPLARAAAYTWAAPVTLVGLLAGLAAGARPALRDGVVVFAPARGVAGLALRLRGFSATALGHVVVAAHEPGPSLLAHELVHVRQAERLGPLFVPVYLALWLRYGYVRHPLERAARLGGRRATGAPA